MTIKDFSTLLYQAGIVHYSQDGHIVVVETADVIHGSGYPDAHSYSKAILEAAHQSGVEQKFGSPSQSVFRERG